jgi:regulator of protease activity HflC (stomatin/prohibitin superfamily)
MDDPLQVDQSTSRRGKAVALGGLAVQCLLTAGMAALTAWSGTGTLSAATWHMLGGIPIWIMLAIVYGQQEIERREELAAEKLAQGDSAALFGEVSDELQRARQRLTTVVAYGLPGTSFLVGGYLVGMGAVLLWRGLAAWSAGGSEPGLGPRSVGMMFAAGAIAFVAFVAGRWISGCARMAAWRMLRGGASYLMSCFLVAVLVLVAAAAVALADDSRFLRLVSLAVPAVMLAVGSEILFTSVLEAYRPRRPGELPRPAFDSRLLGLLTAPESLGEVVGELIRYQFGVEVSGSWFYRLLARSLVPLSLLGVAVLLALSCLVVVGSDEEGVMLRFGAIRGGPRGPGIRLKLPWPIETAETHPTRRVLQLTVSSNLGDRDVDGDSLLWRTGDDRLEQIGKEYYPTALAAAAGGGGLAVLQAEVVVEYRVRDLVDFLETAAAPEAALRVIAQQETSRYFVSRDLPSLMSRGRTEGGLELAKAIQARADTLDLGLEIVDAAITSLKPPGGSVARAFHRQIAAQQERETLVEKARRDAVGTLSRVAGSVAQGRRLDAAILALDALRTMATEADQATEGDGRIAAQLSEIDSLLGEARGEAAERIHAARGSRWSRISAEQTARERFGGELEAHSRAPRYYQAERLFAVLAEALATRRKFVVAGDEGELPVLRMDFADPDSAIETLLGE